MKTTSVLLITTALFVFIVAWFVTPNKIESPVNLSSNFTHDKPPLSTSSTSIEYFPPDSKDTNISITKTESNVSLAAKKISEVDIDNQKIVTETDNYNIAIQKPANPNKEETKSIFISGSIEHEKFKFKKPILILMDRNITIDITSKYQNESFHVELNANELTESENWLIFVDMQNKNFILSPSLIKEDISDEEYISKESILPNLD